MRDADPLQVSRELEHARSEALATYAPKPLIFLSGAMAGFFISWLPLVLFGFLYLWRALFGWPGIEFNVTEQVLVSRLLFGIAAVKYATSAWPFSIALAAWGVAVAFLRALSAFADLNVPLRTSRGVVRIGIHRWVNGMGVPLVAGIVAWSTLPRSHFVAWLIPILLSGMVFNLCYGALQDFFLRLFVQPTPERMQAMALRLALPRVLGFDAVRVDAVQVGPEELRVTACVPEPATTVEIESILGVLFPEKRIHVGIVEGHESAGTE